MEEYNDFLKNIEVWIENISYLLVNFVDYDFLRILSYYVSILQMVLEDLEQKYNFLYLIFMDLEDLLIIFEIDELI